MNKLLIALLLVTGSVYADDHIVPPKGVVKTTNKATLCVSGYTATVRPSTSYTNALKKKWTPFGHKPQEYELDHFIPIELGGDPKSEDNLWLQVWDDARKKDVQETLLHREMCAGVYKPEQVQTTISQWGKK